MPQKQNQVLRTSCRIVWGGTLEVMQQYLPSHALTEREGRSQAPRGSMQRATAGNSFETTKGRVYRAVRADSRRSIETRTLDQAGSHAAKLVQYLHEVIGQSVMVIYVTEFIRRFANSCFSKEVLCAWLHVQNRHFSMLDNTSALFFKNRI